MGDVLSQGITRLTGSKRATSPNRAVGVCVKSASRYYSPITQLSASSSAPDSSPEASPVPWIGCTPLEPPSCSGGIKKNVGNLAFFYDTFFSTRRSGSPWPVHFAYRMRQAPLPRYPSLVAILHAATTIHHVLSILLSRFFSFSTFSIPLSPLYTTYEYVYYVAPRPPDAKKEQIRPACGPLGTGTCCHDG